MNGPRNALALEKGTKEVGSACLTAHDVPVIVPEGNDSGVLVPVAVATVDEHTAAPSPTLPKASSPGTANEQILAVIQKSQRLPKLPMMPRWILADIAGDCSSMSPIAKCSLSILATPLPLAPQTENVRKNKALVAGPNLPSITVSPSTRAPLFNHPDPTGRHLPGQ